MLYQISRYASTGESRRRPRARWMAGPPRGPDGRQAESGSVPCSSPGSRTTSVCRVGHRAPFAGQWGANFLFSVGLRHFLIISKIRDLDKIFITTWGVSLAYYMRIEIILFPGETGMPLIRIQLQAQLGGLTRKRAVPREGDGLFKKRLSRHLDSCGLRERRQESKSPLLATE